VLTGVVCDRVEEEQEDGRLKAHRMVHNIENILNFGAGYAIAAA
jgi:hypothetical protein